MKRKILTIVYIILLEILFQLILSIPLVIFFRELILKPIVINSVLPIIYFISLLFAMRIVLKNKDIDARYIGLRLTAIFFAFGILELMFFGFSFTKTIAYPIMTLLATVIYPKIQNK